MSAATVDRDSRHRAAAVPSDDAELSALDATAQAALVRNRAVTPLELVDAAIARIERLNPTLNAVIIPTFDKARACARARDLPDGPFRGVPFLVKDLICETAGDPFHAGMALLRRRAWVATADSHVAAKLRAAGFVFVGRTNVPELGPIPTTEPEAYGPTRNPWDTTRSAGGSSGGSAAAVAAGLVPAAHGNDGGGSIRIPASECGLFGVKPSRGRVSLGPGHGDVWDGLVVEHALTRSVRDSAAILDAIAGYMPGDPYVAPAPARPFLEDVGADPGALRIGVLRVSPGGVVHVDPRCVAAADDAAKLLASLGHDVERAHPAAMDDPEFMRWLGLMVASSTAWDLEDWGRKLGAAITADDVERTTWALAELGRALRAVDYLEMVAWMQAYTRRMARWWTDGFDLLLTPTLAEPPPSLGEFVPPPGDPLHAMARATPLVIFTAPFNVTGQPAVSVPLSWSASGLPIGVQLVAAYGREDVLFRVGAQLEAARPWAARRPAVFA